MVVVFGAVVAAAQPGQVVPFEERSALLAIFTATGGEHWKDKTGWGAAPGTECEWYGVTCVDSHITWLRLQENGLIGHIPAEATDLKSLESAWLWGNKLTAVPEAWLEHEDRGGFDLRLWGNPLHGGVSEISIEQNNGSLLCSHWMLRIRENSIERASIKCRNRTDADRETYCELSFHDTHGVSDLRKLGRFIEKQGFYKLKKFYTVNQTHAGMTIVRVTRERRQSVVEDYGYLEPLELFGMESAVWGMAPLDWDRVERKPKSACNAFFRRANDILLNGPTFTVQLPAGTTVDAGAPGTDRYVIRDDAGELLTIDSAYSKLEATALSDLPLTEIRLSGGRAMQHELYSDIKGV